MAMTTILRPSADDFITDLGFLHPNKENAHDHYSSSHGLGPDELFR